MKIINKTEVDKFIWDTTQMGAIATALKANFEGDLINVAYQNSITNETVAVIWSSDAYDLEQQAKALEELLTYPNHRFHGDSRVYYSEYSINRAIENLRKQAAKLKEQK